MKATGIVRRVDDLGRIVIPKEIRRTLKIREGDPLEIYTEKDGGVIFRKYSPMGEFQEFAEQMCQSMGSNFGRIAAISDRDSVIALAGAPKRELMDKPNSRELETLMEQRKSYRYTPGNPRLPAAQAQGVLDDVARGAVDVAHDGLLLVEQGVEQRRFAGVGLADDGDGNAVLDGVAHLE